MQTLTVCNIAQTRVVQAYRIVNNKDIRPAMKLDGNWSTAMWLPHRYSTAIMFHDMETA